MTTRGSKAGASGGGEPGPMKVEEAKPQALLAKEFLKDGRIVEEPAEEEGQRSASLQKKFERQCCDDMGKKTL